MPISTQNYLHTGMPLLFVVLAAFFLIVGGKPILQKRPFLMPSRLLFYLMVVAFSPSFLNNIIFSHGFKAHSGLGMIQWLNPLLLVFILFMFWFQMRGYVAYGITEDSFRDALLQSLKKLNLPYEEKMSNLRLTSLELDLQVAVQGWMGTAVLKVRKNNQPGLLRSIACEMNAYYAAHPCTTNKIGCYFYCVLGLFMLAFATALFLLK